MLRKLYRNDVSNIMKNEDKLKEAKIKNSSIIQMILGTTVLPSKVYL